LHEGDVEVRQQAAAALAHLGSDAPAAVSSLAQALSDADPVVRRNAALALSRIGKKAESAVPALAKLLATKEEPDEIRMFARGPPRSWSMCCWIICATRTSKSTPVPMPRSALWDARRARRKAA